MIVLTGTVESWNEGRGYVRADRPLADSRLAHPIPFTRDHLLDGYEPKPSDRINFGLNTGAKKKIRFATCIAPIRETTS